MTLDPSSWPGGGGGGSYTPPTDRQQPFGNSVSIADGAVAKLTWDHAGSGTVLIDRTDTEVPTIITAGIYSITVLAAVAGALTAGGFFEVSFDMNFSGDDAALAVVTSPAQAAGGRPVAVFIGLTWYMPAGADFRITVLSHDGAAARFFEIANAVIQRIT